MGPREKINENKFCFFFYRNKLGKDGLFAERMKSLNESPLFPRKRNTAKRRDSQSAWRRVSASPNATYQYTWMVVMGQYRISGSIRSHLLHFVRSK